MTLGEKLQNLPVQPGVYIHKNAKGQIIYSFYIAFKKMFCSEYRL